MIRLALATLLAASACDLGAVDGSGISVSDLARRVPTLGLHDGAINFCDNFESWDQNGQPVFGQAGYPDLGATARELGDGAWWTPMNVGTVRVSVPWDIALPASAQASLVTAHDPAGTWAQYHATALANEQKCFDAWLGAAAAAGQTVNVAFKPDYDYRDPSTNHILVPEIGVYRSAIAAFVAQYVPAKVHVITPWGEPDYGNPSYPTSSTDTSPGCTHGCEGNELPAANISRAKEVFFLPSGSSGMDPRRARFDDPSCGAATDDACGPVLAAQMWMAVHHACADCVLDSGPTAGDDSSGIVAGDFSGGGGLDGYANLYAEHLNDCAGCAGVRPPTWGLHPYPDTANEEWCQKNTGRDFDPAAQHGGNSVTEKFVDALHALGYHEHTFVWLDEVSVFATDNYAHTDTFEPLTTSGGKCGVNTSTTKPTYSPDVEAKSFRWLYHSLANVRGTVDPGHEPVVARIYYFRSFAGSDPNGDNVTPTNPTANQQALYDAIVHR